LRFRLRERPEADGPFRFDLSVVDVDRPSFAFRGWNDRLCVGKGGRGIGLGVNFEDCEAVGSFTFPFPFPFEIDGSITAVDFADGIIFPAVFNVGVVVVCVHDAPVGVSFAITGEDDAV
jgi:hypothetical protein